MKNFEALWLGVGISLTTATQFRLENFPVGIGELMLVIWMIFFGSQLIINRSFKNTPVVRIFLVFWVISLPAMLIGLGIASYQAKVSGYNLYHDVIAFIFLFFLSTLLLQRIDNKNVLNKIFHFFVYFVGISLLIILLIIPNPDSLNPVLDAWTGNARFQGWSENPNQLALLLSMIPYFALHLFLKTRNNFERLGYLLSVIVCIFSGYINYSDALNVSWIVGGGVLIILTWYQLLAKRFNSYLRNIISVGIPFLLSLFLFLRGHKLYNSIYYDYGKISLKAPPQGAVRFDLWKNGIVALLHSPIFGLGPGSHSGITAPFLDEEAHNTFIDWAANTGIIGLVSYVALLGWIARKAWTKKLLIMIAGLISLVIFSSFHYTLRHPVFWFYLIAIAMLSTESSEEQVANNLAI